MNTFKNSIFLHLVFISIVLMIFSCKKKWFEEKPNKSLTVPATLNDFELLIDNTELNFNGSVLNIVSSDEVHVSETNWPVVAFNTDKNAFVWRNEFPYVSVLDWNKAYNRVFYCNVVLDGLEKVSPKNQEEIQQWSRIKGDALFHRCKSLFELASLYATVFVYNSAGNEIGIPLRLNSDITIISERTTLKKTYSQIVDDLKLAKDLLPITPLYKTRGSKASVFALLSRVYLSMSDFQSAYNYSDSTFAYNHFLINYNTINQNLTNSFPAFPAVNNEIIFYSRAHGSTLIARSALYGRIPKIIYDSYAEFDLRKKLFFTVLADGTINFKGNYTGNVLSFSGLATDEMYLIRAECAARLGNVSEALDDLNTLLRTRWATGQYVDVTGLDQNAAIDLILRERRKELIWRGLRWSDLRRLNLEENRKITLTRTIGGQTYLLEPNSYKYTFPVPDDVLSLAPQIGQSPGWKK